MMVGRIDERTHTMSKTLDEIASDHGPRIGALERFRSRAVGLVLGLGGVVTVLSGVLMFLKLVG